MSKPPLFELIDVTVRFGDVVALERGSLRVEEGARIVLRGPSGSGKSTILRLLLGFVRPSEGEVRFRGESLTPALADTVRETVAFVPQEFDFEEGTVNEIVDDFFGLRTFRERPEPEALDDAWQRLGLPRGIGERRMRELSGGEKQRVALALATLTGRSFFLLDEPTASLDGAAKQSVADFFLGDGEREGALIVSHDEVWNRPKDADVIELGRPD